MKRYPSQHAGAHTGPGRCIRLLEESSPRKGIVLDIGCGRAPLADRVREQGLDYVGVDVDADALAAVRRRGYEAHQLDLGGTREELSSSLRAIVGERSLSAVLAVDVLEHLVEPDRVLNALRDLPDDDGAWSLIVSIPNVTHVDIASKLLLGRWDLTEFGLLDDTHLRFFSERLLSELFRATGWREADAADAQSPASDQLFPVDSPLVRPGAPAHELLRHLSAQSHPHWATYQFVRRFSPADVPDSGHRWAVERESDEERVFASILVRPSEAGNPDHTRLLEDLEAQTSQDFETIDCEEGWNSGIAAAQGRYLCFADETVRLSSRWIEAFQAPRELAGHVLKADVASVRSRRFDEGRDSDSLIASGKPFAINPLDPLLPYRPGPAILAAYAVPLEAARTAGVRFDAAHGSASAAVFLSRAAELCGVAPVARVTVAVSDARRDGNADVASVAQALDSAPLILPAGSATRIMALQRFRWRLTRPLRALKRIGRRLRRSSPPEAPPAAEPRSHPF
jgi:2-polyprenyl-3-methyl-5-hydroxy-6-metoxy-1,4-benzoquinol methylase